MAALTFDGITVHFPFDEPYECQRTFMAGVLEAARASRSALLESPTGTGKTLCLLCALLAFQQQFAHLKRRNRSTNPNADGDKSIYPRIIYVGRTHAQLSQVLRELRKTSYRPQVHLLGGREHLCVNDRVNPRSVPNGCSTRTTKVIVVLILEVIVPMMLMAMATVTRVKGTIWHCPANASI
jgi:regulator of telomere elongation helicase 1